MVNVSEEVIWSVLRTGNAFTTKRSGVILSSERGNLKNVHSFKYSGLANKKAINVSAKDGVVSVTTKVSKAKNASRPKSSWTVAGAKNKKDFRRAAKTIKNQTAGSYYRADLTQAALARWSKLYRTNRPQKEKKGRGAIVKK